MGFSTAQRPTPQFDEDGLLINVMDWSEQLAQEIALRNEIGPLTEAHWEVIRLLREYYLQFGVAPALHSVCRQLHSDPERVHALFHTCLNAWRVAGLPNPGEEAKAYS